MTTMTLAQLIMACSLSTSPHVNDTLHRVVMASSQGNPFWIATSKGHVYTPTHLKRALSLVEGLSNQRLHLGLASISTVHLARLEYEPFHALDSCTNLSIASLELERVLTTSTRSKVQAMHEALATYYDPLAPEGLAALSFGAKVLATQKVDVEEEAVAEHPMDGPTFVIEMSVFGGEGAPQDEGAPLESKESEENGYEALMITKPQRAGIFSTQGTPQEQKDVDVPESQPVAHGDTPEQKEAP